MAHGGIDISTFVVVCLFTCILHICMLRSVFNFQMESPKYFFFIWNNSHLLCSGAKFMWHHHGIGEKMESLFK